jgi:hypothetical protein
MQNVGSPNQTKTKQTGIEDGEQDKIDLHIGYNRLTQIFLSLIYTALQITHYHY